MTGSKLALECVGRCLQERSANFEKSPGPVDDHEVVCRAAMDPRHFRKKYIKSMIYDRDLERGELSIWRLKTDPSNKDIESLVEKLEPKAREQGQQVKAIFGVPASEIRGLEFEHRRAFSVLDDTRADNQGVLDEQHAAIAPCQRLTSRLRDPDAPVLSTLVERLFLKFLGSKLWEASAAPEAPTVT